MLTAQTYGEINRWIKKIQLLNESKGNMNTPRKSLEIYCMIDVSCKFILIEKSNRNYQFCINILCGLKAKIHK